MPISRHLEGDRRLNHYLERIYFYSNRVMHRYCCSRVLDQLVVMFPQVKHQLIWKLLGFLTKNMTQKN